LHIGITQIQTLGYPTDNSHIPFPDSKCFFCASDMFNFYCSCHKNSNIGRPDWL
jgi:hypothetical protein